jgi:hypothetical protein
MATTTNYGWTTPDDTALVKDGASAIRTLGSSVDTTTKALNPSTTLGDIEYRSSTANTNTRLGIGSTGQVLTVSGGVPAWATASSGGLTLLASGTLSGSSVSLTSISQSYKNLQLQIIAGYNASDGLDIKLTINGITTTTYFYTGIKNRQGTLSQWSDASGSGFNFGVSSTNTDDNRRINSIIDIYDYTSATVKMMTCETQLVESTTNFSGYRASCVNTMTTAITNIQIVVSGTTWSGGSYKLFGVN